MTIFLLGQIAVSIILIVLILLQQRGTALGSVFGGGSEFYGTLRGAQQKIFQATVILGAVFIALSLLNIIL
ncbi:MAG: preprotein translocase subunit SecG [Candidatus Nealsonbacteria bacterium]|nr:preprotein translocase subunit SecG [Candidatus Nealsonbacteria bacterium]